MSIFGGREFLLGGLSTQELSDRGAFDPICSECGAEATEPLRLCGDCIRTMSDGAFEGKVTAEWIKLHKRPSKMVVKRTGWIEA